MRTPRPSVPAALPMLLLIGLVTLGTRLAVLPLSTEVNMEADSAHFLNVARCFSRGQGFSNPAAWPAWIKPERLPMPETFKEPAYPWAIAKLAPLTGSLYGAGLLLSLVAGLLTPFLTWMLARRLHPERAVADLAALMVAISPLLIAQSVRVMVESVYAATLTLVWVVLASRAGDGRARGLAVDAAAGVLIGLAFMLRAQTLLAAPAVLVLLGSGRPLAQALRRATVVLAAAALTASPFLLRNLRLFGSPFHSDVAAFGLMPYIDRLSLSATLERPPSALEYALHHLPQLIVHLGASAVGFAVRTLPKDLLGNPVWTVPLAAGALLSLGRWRHWLFVYVYLGITLPFIFVVNPEPRYFVSSVPLWCVLTAPGALWIARLLDPALLWGRLRGRHLVVGALGALVLIQAADARRDVVEQVAFETPAARSQTAFLREHLAPDEAVMAINTSYYAYWVDRPAVYLVIAEPPRFMNEVRRLKVRYAALPTSRLAEIAARYPGGRLPAALLFDHADAATDVTVFRVR